MAIARQIAAQILVTHLPSLWRILYEILRFAVFAFLAMQLIAWFDEGTALLGASRRGIPLGEVLAERVPRLACGRLVTWSGQAVCSYYSMRCGPQPAMRWHG